MTRDETYQVLAYLAGAYPRYYTKVTQKSMNMQLITWTDVLEEYSFEDVMRGVKGYISTDASGFPPPLGQIVGNMHRVMHPDDMSGLAAWNLVRRALNSPRDQYDAAFAALPEIVQKTLGGKENGVAQLRAWSVCDISTFETVEQSNFLRMFDATEKRVSLDMRTPRKVLAIRGELQKELEEIREERKEITQEARHEIEHAEAPQDKLEALRRRLNGKHTGQ